MTTHFDKALEATRMGYVAAQDVAKSLETAGLLLKAGRDEKLQMLAVRRRLMDLRLLVDDVEAHLRLSDSAEDAALEKKKKIVLDAPGAPV